MKLICFIAIITLTFSCTEKREYAFTNGAIPINGEEIRIDSLIGRPSEIIYKQGLIMYADPVNGMSMGVIDASKLQFVKRIFPIGRGPNELVNPFKLDCTSESKYFNVFQFQTGGLLKVATSEGGQYTVERGVQFEDRPANVKETINGFVGIGPYSEGRLMRYDKGGKPVEVISDYPFGSKQGLDGIQKFLIYQAQIFTHKDRLVVASSYSDNLEFYKIESNKAHLLKKYETYDVNYSIIDGQFKLSDNSIMSYKWIYGTNQYCYLLYSGKTLEANNHRVAGGKYIFVFDWDGNFIKSFQSEQHLYSFCVNDEDNIIYAFGMLDDGITLLSFSI